MQVNTMSLSGTRGPLAFYFWTVRSFPHEESPALREAPAGPPGRYHRPSRFFKEKQNAVPPRLMLSAIQKTPRAHTGRAKQRPLPDTPTPRPPPTRHRPPDCVPCRYVTQGRGGAGMPPLPQFCPLQEPREHTPTADGASLTLLTSLGADSSGEGEGRGKHS